MATSKQQERGRRMGERAKQKARSAHWIRVHALLRFLETNGRDVWSDRAGQGAAELLHVWGFDAEVDLAPLGRRIEGWLQALKFETWPELEAHCVNPGPPIKEGGQSRVWRYNPRWNRKE